jgi:hypothetical protein
MTKINISKIVGLIAEIKAIDEQLISMSGWDDTVGELMHLQFQQMKREMLKDLMVELIRGDFDHSEIDSFFTHFSEFLSKKYKSEKLSPEIKSSLQEVERLMAVA